MNSSTIHKWGNVVHKHRRAERRYWWTWSTDTFPCSLCFYSVLSLIVFLALERQEKEGLFEKLQEKPNCWIYEFVLVSLCLSSEEYSKVTTVKCFSDICIFSLTYCGVLFYECMCGFCRVGDALLPISRFGVSLKRCLIWSTDCSWCLITYQSSLTSSDHTAGYFSNEKF